MKSEKRIREIAQAAIKNGKLWIISNDKYGYWRLYRVMQHNESISWQYTFDDFADMCNWVADSGNRTSEIEYVYAIA